MMFLQFFWFLIWFSVFFLWLVSYHISFCPYYFCSHIHIFSPFLSDILFLSALWVLFYNIIQVYCLFLLFGSLWNMLWFCRIFCISTKFVYLIAYGVKSSVYIFCESTLHMFDIHSSIFLSCIYPLLHTYVIFPFFFF